AADVAKMKSAKTVEGSDVKIDARKGVKINNATVSSADVGADNGVIHIIDTVLMPA
ncbi:MAG: fasciclin domain-containing protein, partial [Waterburya sp.]